MPRRNRRQRGQEGHGLARELAAEFAARTDARAAGTRPSSGPVERSGRVVDPLSRPARGTGAAPRTVRR